MNAAPRAGESLSEAAKRVATDAACAAHAAGLDAGAAAARAMLRLAQYFTADGLRR